MKGMKNLLALCETSKMLHIPIEQKCLIHTLNTMQNIPYEPLPIFFSKQRNPNLCICTKKNNGRESWACFVEIGQ